MVAITSHDAVGGNGVSVGPGDDRVLGRHGMFHGITVRDVSLIQLRADNNMTDYTPGHTIILVLFRPTFISAI